ncbi:MAG: winged helix-turn-helix transcriptional regulator [Candidatus Marinimicrobia bacterium]|nr:winged helix-turn-helix transcriptional regulator [Candidatus Neomarinimicrobiota bacterium]
MKTQISIEFIQTASRVLKTLGHPDRLKIVEYLDEGEKTVGQIQRHLDMLQPVVSQHLKKMHDRDIVIFRREGTRYFYSLANEFIFKILNCMADVQDKISSGEWSMEFQSE